ncbi:MAG: precorrin-6y C5,15-methyltransferase (decarboxylating) subunit CbiE [Anaerovoracaceae bacterium]
MKKIYIIGIGMGNIDTITVKGLRLIEQCQGLVGAKRMVEAFLKDGGGDKPCCYSVKPEEIFRWIKAEGYSETAVLMSGDVGFYSGAKKLVELVEQDQDYAVELVPGISSLQYFSAKLNLPWSDIHVVSLHHHGENFIGAIQSQEKVFLLTGGERTVAYVCNALVEAGLEHTLVHVGQRLSYEEEKIVEGSPKELAQGSFDPLSVMLVENPAPIRKQKETPGIPEEEFIRGKVPMTKTEVRSVALSKLGIQKNSIVYDVGAGTGSVSVEAAMQAIEGCVYAVEVNPEGTALIEKNKEKFGLSNLQIIQGKAPQVLMDLPAPDQVFIGGTKGQINNILALIAQKNPHATVVIDAIALESVVSSITALKNNGFNQVDVTQLMVSKAKEVGPYNMMIGQNPVYIIQGERMKDDSESHMEPT